MNINKLAQELGDYFLKSFVQKGVTYHIIGVQFERRKVAITYTPKRYKIENVPMFMCSSEMNKIELFTTVSVIAHLLERDVKNGKV